MNQSLPELLREEAEIINQIEMAEGSVDDEILYLKKANLEAKDKKVDNYGKAIRRYNIEIKHAKEMEKYWKEKRQVLENEQSKFKGWIQYLVQKLGGSLKSSATIFTIQTNPTKLVIDPTFNLNNLPKEYCRIDIKPDVTKIKEEFDSLPETIKKYMTLQQGESLRMKGGI